MLEVKFISKKEADPKRFPMLFPQEFHEPTSGRTYGIHRVRPSRDLAWLWLSWCVMNSPGGKSKEASTRLGSARAWLSTCYRSSVTCILGDFLDQKLFSSTSLLLFPVYCFLQTLREHCAVVELPPYPPSCQLLTCRSGMCSQPLQSVPCHGLKPR